MQNQTSSKMRGEISKNPIEVYYFSGTGNSLYVAKELQSRIPETKLSPIAGLLSKDAVKSNGDTVGFVFPTYGMTLPIPVKTFLKKLDLESATYVFAIATRGGTKCFAFSKIDALLKEQGKRLDACLVLNMPGNDPKLKDWQMATPEKIAQLETDVNHRLDAFQRVIINKEPYRVTDRDYIDFPYSYPVNYVMERLVLFGVRYAEYDGLKDYFYADSKCVGCGTCEKVCLSNKIKMVDKKPVWQKNVKCQMCYSCLNYCPEQSVQIKSKWYMKSYTSEKGRYLHPYASARDIAQQKELSEKIGA
jgi:ferredoxin